MGNVTDSTPETLIRKVLTACGSCEDCRHFIEDACLFLPELFRLHDRRREHGEEATQEELKHLADLCNLCGLCPCANIRREIMAAKAAYAAKNCGPCRTWGGLENCAQRFRA
jgi:glycerol-3-phosphate dehydrogenase subunit C